MLLEVRDLSVSYGDIEAVHGINFNVEKGELISIIGANGAGKSTTLRAIMGVQEVRSGRITFEGMDITHMPAHKRARLGIRIVPERARCFPQLTVFENLQMGVYGEQAALKELDGIYELSPLRERADSMRTLFPASSSSLRSHVPSYPLRSCFWWTKYRWG